MLTINKEFRKGILFIRLSGELSKDTLIKFNEEVSDMISEMKIGNVVFNINELKFIDIYGINTLISNYNTCKRNKGISMLCIKDSCLIKDDINKSAINEYMNEVSDEISAINLINI